MRAKWLQSCPTLCDPVNCSPPGSSVHGMLQARILEWVAMPSSRGSSWPRDQTLSLMSPVLAGGFFTTSTTWEAHERESHSVMSPTDYTVHGVLQARILGWAAFPFSRGSSQPRDRTQVSRIACGFFTSWATREAQEYWSGEPIPSSGDLPDPGIELGSPPLQADSLPAELWGSPINPCIHIFTHTHIQKWAWTRALRTSVLLQASRDVSALARTLWLHADSSWSFCTADLMEEGAEWIPESTNRQLPRVEGVSLLGSWNHGGERKSLRSLRGH